MPSNLICSCCNKSYKQNLMITCSVCTRVFKHSCVNITSEEFRILCDPDKGYDWSCSNCRKIGGQLKELKNLILSLQNDIQLLKDENRTLKSSDADTDLENVIEEINERNHRKRNLIIFGLSEQKQEDTPEARMQKDKNEVENIIGCLDKDFELHDIKPNRLGRYNKDKVRPIKISLKDEDQVRELIKNAKNLKNSRYKKVFVSVDRTQMQLRHYKKLKEEVAHKNSIGQEKFKIKYFNGTPKIVKDLN